MRKFKLVNKYPGHEDLGTIVKEVKGYGYLNEKLNENAYKIYPEAFTPKSHVEDQPEFWEEIVEKTYETAALNIYRYESNSIVTAIEEVKRLSDGEVFKVGDRYKSLSGTYTIGILEEYNNTILVKSDNGLSVCILDHVEKVRKLFTTDDGVDIYEGDVCWAGYPFSDINSFHEECYEGNSTNMKYFSTKEAVEEYVNGYKTTFTLDEVTEIVNSWSMSRVDKGDILRFYEKTKK